MLWQFLLDSSVLRDVYPSETIWLWLEHSDHNDCSISCPVVSDCAIENQYLHSSTKTTCIPIQREYVYDESLRHM